MAVGDVGFPLTEILDTLHVTTLETMQADKAASDKVIADLNAAAAVAKQESDAALTAVQAELAATQSKLQEILAVYEAITAPVAPAV
jgi:hypothetical protein